MQLTEQEREAVQRGEAVHATDAETNMEVVLLRPDMYERVRALLSDFDPSQAYPAIDEAWREGWDDPKMADYDRYEDYRK